MPLPAPTPVAPDVAAVVLAAGLGTRMRPLSELRPKALFPIGHDLLVDLAIERAEFMCGDIAVNVHHHRGAMEAHLAGRVRLSIEEGEPLGTAGGVANLREWIAGRPVAQVNADGWTPAAIPSAFVGEWDRERVRVLVVDDPEHADFDGRWRMAGMSLLPAVDVARLEPVPSSLADSWDRARAEGRFEVFDLGAPFYDCGTPREYLAANMAWSGGESVVGLGASIEGEVVGSVVWPFGVVRKGERLVDAIRAGFDTTVTVG